MFHDEGKISRILFVEDEDSIVKPISRGLREVGFLVERASDGESGLQEALREEYDLLIVDWRLPRLDGRSLVKRVRASGIATPILMLTAMRDVEYRVSGLDAGADDYLTKPFAFTELLARIRALLRRAHVRAAGQHENATIHLEVGPLSMNTARRTAHLSQQALDLRSKEYRLLEVLMRLGGQVATRTFIAEHVWGSPFEVTDNAIDVTVSNLRQRLNEARPEAIDQVLIETVRGIGYRLRVEDY